MATIVDGNALAREIRAEVTRGFAELAARGNPTPGVAIVQIGDDQSASMYTRRLQKSFADAGVRVELCQLDASISASDAAAAVARLSADSAIHGIQIQTPVPPQVSLATLLDALDPRKDVDGI